MLANQEMEYGEDVTGCKRLRAWVTGAAVLMMAIICIGCSAGVSKDPATHAQIVDRSATSTYLRTREVLIRSSMADLPAGRGPMAGFVMHVRAECPDALRGTPVDDVTPLARNMARRRAQLRDARFVVEIEQSLEVAEQESQTAAARRFATTVASIRWSDPRIADLVNTFIQIELQRRQMPQPDVCRAIREWAIGGYQNGPVLTPAEPRGALGRKWMLEMAALGCGKLSPAPPMQVLRALRPYQQPGGHPTTREVEVLEGHLALEELRARGDAARSLDQALGLLTTRHKRSKRQRSTTGLVPPPELPSCSDKPELLSEQVNEPASG